jgi:lipopolysaccharide/colanic/teichoic acid biosynthesis glycosyltransferase
MRMRTPSSRGSFRIQFSAFDVVWAVVAPLLALYIRDAYILSIYSQAGDSYVLTFDGVMTAALYCAVSLLCALIAFLAFRLHAGMTSYFSVHDVLDVVKAIVFAEFLIFLFLFTFTRLEGIPRSTPLIHAFVLGAGLIAVRAVGRLFGPGGDVMVMRRGVASERIIMIGSTRLTSLYMRFIEAYAHNRQVIAVLDDNPEAIGRNIAGLQVLGHSQQLEAVIEEFKVHGVHTDRVIVGGDADILSEEALHLIERVCNERQLRLDFVPELIGLKALQGEGMESAKEAIQRPEPVFVRPLYFKYKPILDFIAALTLIVVFSPLWLVVSVLALIDVGSPIFFWQQRIGLDGRNFLLHKVRTLQSPFDWRGNPVPESYRLSWIGVMLRKTRLDELPQLLNILVGDMSLIGPRPLLPKDQPPNPTVRLSVRPGITGWAQVNGGKLLTPREKDALDEWYIRNASLWLDLQILLKTIYVIIKGEQRSVQALALARSARRGIDDLQGHAIGGLPLVRESKVRSGP